MTCEVEQSCPVCDLAGRKGRLKLCQLNLEEAIPLCSDAACFYPLGLSSTASVVVKRSAWVLLQEPSLPSTCGESEANSDGPGLASSVIVSPAYTSYSKVAACVPHQECSSATNTNVVGGQALNSAKAAAVSSCKNENLPNPVHVAQSDLASVRAVTDKSYLIRQAQSLAGKPVLSIACAADDGQQGATLLPVAPNVAKVTALLSRAPSAVDAVAAKVVIPCRVGTLIPGATQFEGLPSPHVSDVTTVAVPQFSHGLVAHAEPCSPAPPFKNVPASVPCLTPGLTAVSGNVSGAVASAKGSQCLATSLTPHGQSTFSTVASLAQFLGTTMPAVSRAKQIDGAVPQVYSPTRLLGLLSYPLTRPLIRSTLVAEKRSCPVSSPLRSAVVAEKMCRAAKPVVVLERLRDVPCSKYKRLENDVSGNDVDLTTVGVVPAKRSSDACTMLLQSDALRSRCQYVQWKNADALCWLDVILCLLVHCEPVRKLYVGSSVAAASRSPIGNLVRVYCDAEQLICKGHVSETVAGARKVRLFGRRNGNKEDVVAVKTGGGYCGESEEGCLAASCYGSPVPAAIQPLCAPLARDLTKAVSMLASAREEVWQALQPLMRCEKGRNDSPVTALPVVLRLDGSVGSLFAVEYSWELRCLCCGHYQVDRCANVVPTFSTVPSSFCMTTNRCFVRSCLKCCAPNQKRCMSISKLGDFLMLHFASGLHSNDFYSYDFDHDGSTYTVAAVVQYRTTPDHFSIWLHDVEADMWMECDDLRQPLCEYSKTRPVVAAEQVHIVVWSRSRPSQAVPLAEAATTARRSCRRKAAPPSSSEAIASMDMPCDYGPETDSPAAQQPQMTLRQRRQTTRLLDDKDTNDSSKEAKKDSTVGPAEPLAAPLQVMASVAALPLRKAEGTDSASSTKSQQRVLTAPWQLVSTAASRASSYLSRVPQTRTPQARLQPTRPCDTSSQPIPSRAVSYLEMVKPLLNRKVVHSPTAAANGRAFESYCPRVVTNPASTVSPCPAPAADSRLCTLPLPRKVPKCVSVMGTALQTRTATVARGENTVVEEAPSPTRVQDKPGDWDLSALDDIDLF